MTNRCLKLKKTLLKLIGLLLNGGQSVSLFQFREWQTRACLTSPFLGCSGSLFHITVRKYLVSVMFSKYTSQNSSIIWAQITWSQQIKHSEKVESSFYRTANNISKYTIVTENNIIQGNITSSQPEFQNVKHLDLKM